MDINSKTIRICRRLSREACLEVFSTLIAPKLQSDGFVALAKSTRCDNEKFIEVYGFGDYFIDVITNIFMTSDEMELKYKPYGSEKEYKVFVFKKF